MHPRRLPLLLASVFALASAAPAGAQVLYGRVADASDGGNVAAALISVLDPSGAMVASTIGGMDGRFDLPLPAAGDFRVYVTRIGFRPGASPVVTVGEGERVGVDLALRTDDVELETVQARTHVTRPFRDHRALGFYDRLDAGMGRYLTRGQILASNAPTTTQLLRGIPGVPSGEYTSTGMWPGGYATRTRRSRGRGTLDSYGTVPGCSPSVYIDGFLQVLKTGQRLDEMVEPSEIWGVEVYPRGSEIPSELPRASVNQNCGAIVIWTLNS